MRKNLELHYAKKELKNEDILKIDLKNLNELQDMVDHLCCGKSTGIVYLFATEDESNFVFVTESHLEIQELILSHKRFKTVKQFFLQEYDSYESAYEVALMMKEVSPLCYAPE